MKSTFSPQAPRNLAATVGFAGSLLLLLATLGCTTKTIYTRPMTTETWPPPPPATPGAPAPAAPAAGAAATAKFVRGIPYFLPTSVFDVSIESVKDDKARHKEFNVSSASRLVADPTAGYLIDSVTDWSVSKTHTFKTKDSLLTLVSTEDDNKLGEMIADLLSTVANVVSFGATGGMPHALKDMTDQPTNDEINDLYSAVTPGPHKFAFRRAAASKASLPGTRDLLKLAVDPVDEFGPVTVNASGIRAPQAASGTKGFEGVYARVLKPMRFDVTLQIPLDALYGKRLAELPATVNENIKTIEEAQEAIAELQMKFKQVQENKAELESDLKKIQALPLTAETQSQITSLKEKIIAVDATLAGLAKEGKEKEKAITKLMEVNDSIIKDDGDPKKLSNGDGWIAKNLYWQAHLPGGAVAVVATRSVVTMVPDEDLIVQLPVTRSPLGVSKNTLTLEAGILAEYRTEKTSTGAASIKILYNAVGKLVELPAKIIQLKIDYSTREKALLEAQQNLDTLVTSIANSKLPAAAPSEHALEIARLNKEKEILAIQKELAEMRAAIERANNPPAEHSHRHR